MVNDGKSLNILNKHMIYGGQGRSRVVKVGKGGQERSRVVKVVNGCQSSQRLSRGIKMKRGAPWIFFVVGILIVS